MKMLKRCGFKDVLSEYRYRGSARVGKDDSRRVPDVTRVHPDTVKEYVIGATIFRNITAPQHRSTRPRAELGRVLTSCDAFPEGSRAKIRGKFPASNKG